MPNPFDIFDAPAAAPAGGNPFDVFDGSAAEPARFGDQYGIPNVADASTLPLDKPANIAEVVMDALGVRDTTPGYVIQDTGRAIGGGLEDAARGALNLPADIVNFFGGQEDRIGDYVLPNRMPQSQSVVNQILRPLVQFGTGFAGVRSATANVATDTPEIIRSLVQGAIGDTIVSAPEDQNLSNVIDRTFGTSLPTSKVEGEAPLIGRLKDAAEGGALGVAVDTLLLSVGRALRRNNIDKPLEQVTTDDITAMASNGDPDAISVLRELGMGDEQIAALSPGRAEEFAARATERRAADASRLDVNRLDGSISPRERGQQLGNREGQGRANQAEIAAADAGVVVERTRAAQQQMDELAGELETARATGADPTEIARLQTELDALQALRRQPAPESIPVTPQGQGITGNADEAAQASIVRDRNKNMPVPVEPQATRMTPTEVRAAQRMNEGGNRNAAGVDGPLTAPEGRAPQTRSDIQTQREAEGAFRLADTQRGMAGPDVRDTRPGGRPQGGVESQRTVLMDEGRPVRVIDEANGVARVERYDPRTGQSLGDAYEIPRSRLTSGQYAQEPRMAQEFEQAAQGPYTRRQEAAAGLERQTYRTTPEDPAPTTQGAGDFDVRSPRPEQGDGPNFDAGPGRSGPNPRGPFTSAEEIFRDFQRRQEQARAGRADEAGARAEQKYQGAKSNNTGKQSAGDGRWDVDEDGYVMSTAGGPIKFADQKQAAQWILKRGQKESPDQIFEIANHPTGGFTVRERGRTEPPPGGGQAADDAAQAADDFTPPKDAPEEVRQLTTKLYSNPLDPEIMANIARSIAGSRFAQGVKSLLKQSSALTKTPREALAHIGRTIFYSADGRIRAVAKRYSSKTAEDLANMFYPKVGTDGSDGAGRSFDEAVELRRNARQNEIGRILEPIKPEQMDQLGRLVRNPGQIRKGTPLGDAATGLIKMLKEELAYLREAGVEVGEVKNGYLPRVIDSDMVVGNLNEFRKDAEKFFMSVMRMPRSEARDAASDWADRIAGFKTDVAGDFATLPGSHKPNFTKGRTLPDGVDAKGPLAKYYVSDPRELLGVYVAQGARRAEWARRMGSKMEKWAEMKRSMIDEGLPPEALNEVMEGVSAIAGMKASGAGSSILNGALGWARVWNTIGLLEKATLSSIQEIAMPAIRSGDVAAVMKGVANTFRDLTLSLHKSGKGQELRDFAEDFGMIINNSFHSMSAVRFAGGTPGTKMQQKVLDSYFRRIGLEQLTRATRIAAIDQASVFVRRMAISAQDGSRIAKEFLSELGVEPDQMDGFVKWVAGNTQQRSLIPAATVKEAGKAGEAYITAISRFMDQSVMRPSTATRPTWASHPVGSMIFQLQAFLYAFQKNAINRNLKMVRRAATDRSLRATERLQLVAPAAAMTMLVPLAIGIGAARDAIFGDKKRLEMESRQDKILKGLSRSGLFGAFDPYINMVTGVKYNRSVLQSMAGPLFGRFGDTADTVLRLGVRNSENTNTAERAFYRSVYDMVLEPSLNLALTATPVGPVSAAATQAAGAGWSREQFVTWLAGPAQVGRPKSGAVKPLPTY